MAGRVGGLERDRVRPCLSCAALKPLPAEEGLESEYCGGDFGDMELTVSVEEEKEREGEGKDSKPGREWRA